MDNEVILRKAIEKAQENGLKLLFSQREVYEKILTKKMPLWVGTAFLFQRPFAEALGYTLADLGVWCDEGKDPFEYIRQTLDN
jgi:hypothetical protein